MQLAPYNFTIHYRKGSLNPADGPSRRSDYKERAKEFKDLPIARLMPTLQNKLANGVALKAGVPRDCQAQPEGLEAKSIVRALVAQVAIRVLAIEAVTQDGPYSNKRLRELIQEG